MEHGLSQLEGKFVKIRDTKLAPQQRLDAREHVLLYAFLAAAHARTPTQRDHLGSIWAQALAQANQLQDWAKTATPAQRRAVSGLPSSDPDRSFSLEEVQALAERPMQTTLASMVGAETPLLAKLDLLIFTTTDTRPALQILAVAAVPHWITSSALSSSDGGIVRPRIFAVLRLMPVGSSFMTFAIPQWSDKTGIAARTIRHRDIVPIRV